MSVHKCRPSPAHVDKRGHITNLLTVPIQHVALIHSLPGSIRGNHFHRTDSHYTYLVSGSASYYQEATTRLAIDAMPGGDWLSDLETTDLLPGDMVYTPAGIAHTFLFREESVFLAFTTESRVGGRYEKDTVPFILKP